MCFSVDWLLHLLIVLVVLCGCVAILKIWVFPLLAAGDARIPATINILIWICVAIFVIYLVAYVLSCALSGGFMLPRLR